MESDRKGEENHLGNLRKHLGLFTRRVQMFCTRYFNKYKDGDVEIKSALSEVLF